MHETVYSIHYRDCKMYIRGRNSHSPLTIGNNNYWQSNTYQYGCPFGDGVSTELNVLRVYSLCSGWWWIHPQGFINHLHTLEECHCPIFGCNALLYFVHVRIDVNVTGVYKLLECMNYYSNYGSHWLCTFYVSCLWLQGKLAPRYLFNVLQSFQVLSRYICPILKYFTHLFLCPASSCNKLGMYI